MAHETRADYEAMEVERDVWICDSCDKEIHDESDVRTFLIDPVVKFDSNKTDENLVFLRKTEGKRAVKESTWVESKLKGHMCDECVDSFDLSTGFGPRPRWKNVVYKLRERIL